MIHKLVKAKICNVLNQLILQNNVKQETHVLEQFYRISNALNFINIRVIRTQ
jgi:hypothetical protein